MGISNFVLPPLVLLEDFGNSWHIYLEAIYEVFRQDFVSSTPNIENKRFALKRHPVIEGKEATFWHIINK